MKLVNEAERDRPASYTFDEICSTFPAGTLFRCNSGPSANLRELIATGPGKFLLIDLVDGWKVCPEGGLRYTRVPSGTEFTFRQE